MMGPAEVIRRFTYSKPTEEEVKVLQGIRERTLELAIYVDENCPDSREKSLAMTKLEEFVTWANASIVRKD